MLPADPDSTLVPPSENPGVLSSQNGNMNIEGGPPSIPRPPPIPRPRSQSTWSSGSPSEWEVLSSISSPSRGIIKVIADFDENHPNWFEGAVKILAGSQVKSIKKNFQNNIYNQVKIGDENVHVFIPKQLMQPFIQTADLPPPFDI